VSAAGWFEVLMHNVS